MTTNKRRLLVTLSKMDELRLAFLKERLGKKFEAEVMRAGLRALASKHGFREASK